MEKPSKRSDPRLRQVAGFFDRQAPSYDGAYDGLGPSGHALRARLEAVLRLLGNHPGTVLDVGMGPGRLCFELSLRGWTAFGIDPSGEMVARARARIPNAADQLREGRAEALDFPQASFDAVVATGVLEYVRDRSAALREIARVLRPGGRAVISIPNHDAPYCVWYGHVFYPLARRARRLLGLRRPERADGGGPFARAEFERLVAAAGMRVQSVEYTNVAALLSPLDILFPKAASWLTRRLERRSTRLGRVLATQLVFALTKRE